MNLNVLNILLTAAAEETEYVNITPTLLRFAAKFFIVFAVIAVVGILTPAMAKKVDAMRAKHAKRQILDDPRCAAVKSIYDTAPPDDDSADTNNTDDAGGAA